MKQVICGRGGGGTSSSQFGCPVASVALNASEGPVNAVWPATGVLRNWIITLDTAPGAGTTHTFTLRKNGVDTAAVITIADTAVTGRYTASDISVTAGDVLTYSKVSTVGTPASFTFSAYSIEFEGSTAKESGYSTVATGNWVNTATRWLGTFVGGTINATSGDSVANVCPIAGTITALYCALNANVGASPKNWLIQLYKNGVLQDGSGGTVDTRLNITGAGTSSGNTTFSLSVSPGDLIYTEIVPTSTPSGSRGCVGIRFQATTDGQAVVASGGGTGNLSAGTAYQAPNTHAAALWQATEANAQAIGGVSTFTLSNLYVRLITAPGAGGSGKSFTLSLRNNSASPSGTPSATVLETATTANDTSGSIKIQDGNAWDIRSVPANSPTVSPAAWAAIQVVESGIIGILSIPTVGMDSLTTRNDPTAWMQGGMLTPTQFYATTPLPWFPRYETLIPSPVPDVAQYQQFGGVWYIGSLKITQYPVEDLEQILQASVRLTQFTSEDLEKIGQAVIRLTQMPVEILIPFTCQFVPLPTPGCVFVLGGGTGSATPGCVDNPPVGAGSTDDGCVPDIPNG